LRVPRARLGVTDVEVWIFGRGAVLEMEAGPPGPFCRGWLQTTACCCDWKRCGG